MVVESQRLDDPALGVSISPLLPSSIDEDDAAALVGAKKRVHFEPFQPTHTVFTPKLSDAATLRYRKPDDRVASSSSLAPPTSVSSIVQPNYDDFLRRVSVVLYQHVRRCEKRYREQRRTGILLPPPATMATTSTATTAAAAGDIESSSGSVSAAVAALGAGINGLHKLPEGDEDNEEGDDEEDGESRTSHWQSTVSQSQLTGPASIASPKLVDMPVDELFREEHFVTPQFRYTFLRLPRVHPLTCYMMEKVTAKSHVPTVDEIFRFCKNLFNKAQLSAECTIVCLIYIERLMEQAAVPLLAGTWKPIVLCGLLLASKVWQDLSSWNVEISNIYPQYPLHSINRLERLFLHHIQWDLYISASVYAKYYFALRSLTEKKDFRRRYNYTMRVDPPNSKRLEERSAAIRHELYSKSL
ncbi:hypothetical protein PINS_up008352 [Pythium insidiosum]|nr:hypothetical protein PINS_up008352 [Pythium insidiosum]